MQASSVGLNRSASRCTSANRSLAGIAVVVAGKWPGEGDHRRVAQKRAHAVVRSVLNSAAALPRSRSYARSCASKPSKVSNKKSLRWATTCGHLRRGSPCRRELRNAALDASCSSCRAFSTNSTVVPGRRVVLGTARGVQLAQGDEIIRSRANPFGQMLDDVAVRRVDHRDEPTPYQRTKLLAHPRLKFIVARQLRKSSSRSENAATRVDR